EEASHAGDLAGMAASVRVVRVSRARNLVRRVLALPSTRPVTHTMLDGPDPMRAIADVVPSTPPGVVLAYCSGMARVIMAPPLDTLPFVLDMVDVDSAKWAALARVTAPPLSWIYAREARVLGRFEAVASTAASSTLVVTPRERDTL